MNELIAPGLAMGTLALAMAVLYAAWHESSAKIRAMPVCWQPLAPSA